MEYLIWFAVTGGVLIALAALWYLSRPRFRPDMLFSRRPALLSPGELRFYQTLTASIPARVTVFAKVRLMDLVTVPNHAWRKYGAPGSGMHVDFIIADAVSTEALLVIELDDRSHRLAAAGIRDAFKEAALAAAGIPVMRVLAAARYDEAELTAKVGKLLKGCT